MQKATMYVEIGSSYKENPIKMAIEQIAKTFGAEIWPEFLRGEDEVWLAVTNSADKALSILKETENTLILVAHMTGYERGKAEALASRFAGRVISAGYLEDETDKDANLVAQLIRLISGRLKEVEG